MSELEKLISELSEEDVMFLESTVFDTSGNIVTVDDFNKALYLEETTYAQKDAVQYSLKINLNSVNQ